MRFSKICLPKEYTIANCEYKTMKSCLAHTHFDSQAMFKMLTSITQLEFRARFLLSESSKLTVYYVACVLPS